MKDSIVQLKDGTFEIKSNGAGTVIWLTSKTNPNTSVTVLIDENHDMSELQQIVDILNDRIIWLGAI